MRRVSARRGDEVAHRSRLADAFLEELALLVFLVEHQLRGILRRVFLAGVAPDADLPEHPFHAEGARLVGDDGHEVLSDVLVAREHLQDLHERHGGRRLAVLAALEETLEGG